MFADKVFCGGKNFLLATALCAGHSLVWASPASPEAFELRKPESAIQLFPAGVYTYYNQAGKLWDPVTMRSHLRYLSSQGINTIHAATIKFEGRDDITLLDIAQEFGIHVIWQIGNAYLPNGGSPSHPERISNATAAINGAINNSSLLAFSVREEVLEADVPALFEYYENIQDSVGAADIPFFLLHDTKGAISRVFNEYDEDQNLPELTGTDRYFFRWSFSDAGGYIKTPSKAFSLLLNDANTGLPAFTSNTVRPAQKFYSVFTSNTERHSRTLPEIQALAYKNDAPDSDCGQLPVTTENCSKYNRWITLAQQGNQGLSYVSGADGNDSVESWSMYRPPQGATSAQAWLSVAAGAQGMMAWHANPESGSSSIIGMFGSDGLPHGSFGELAQAARDLQPFGRIIDKMQRNTSADALLTISTPSDSTLASNVVARAYAVPGIAGQVFVLANTYIGTWAGNSTTDWLSTTPPYQSFHIDETGELDSSDFTPAAPLIVNAAASSTVFDLQSGAELADSNGDSIPDIEINPGSGRLLYVGQAADLHTLRAYAGITSTVPIAGRALLTADQRAQVEQRLVVPASPLIDDSAYHFYTRDITLNQRYKLDVTLQTESGGAFGALAIGYDANWNIVTTQGIGIWNRSATTPTQFVSNEFVVRNDDPDVAHSRVVFFRSNQQGRVIVSDAWLQSLESETRVTGYYRLKVLKDPSRTYKVAVNARALPGETTTLGLMWYNCYDVACISKDGGHHLINWNTALTQQNQLFLTPEFSSEDSSAVRVMVVILKANNAAFPNNTLVLERASAWAVD